MGTSLEEAEFPGDANGLVWLEEFQLPRFGG